MHVVVYNCSMYHQVYNNKYGNVQYCISNSFLEVVLVERKVGKYMKPKRNVILCNKKTKKFWFCLETMHM